MIAKYKKDIMVCRSITIAAVTVSALPQTYVIQTFIRPANLLSSGFIGVAILIDRITSLYGHNTSISLGMLVLSIPVVFLCSKSISIRFTFHSMPQVFPAGFFLKVYHSEPLFNNVFLDVIFGGFLYRLATAIALCGNASTGDTDFITPYVFNKTEESIWEYVFVGNYVVLCIFGYVFGRFCAGYSILFQFISTRAISTFHHRYERVALQITTIHAEDVTKAYVKEYRRGISCVDAVGGHSHSKVYPFHTVVPSYEVNDIVRLMREQDPHVIVSMIETENFYGGFYQAPTE